ncbi:MAG: sigma-70 family RNA polymerase sigma factor [Planctomycetes bacterium]|nr:sigma-70 family RNA polymerase sigma factor [Planctomycetota bacterium]
MTKTASQVRALIVRARGGDRGALGELLETFRGYMRILAEREIGPRLQARVHSSDVVQKTFLSACRNFKDFAGSEQAEFLAWLRRIHERNIRDTIRDNVQVQKRAVGNERPLPEPAAGQREISDARTSSPSQRAMRGEDAVQLAQALETLPDDQREAVRLRHLEGWPLADIVHQMGRSKDAVASLLKRGLQNLRKRLSKVR